MAPLTTFFTSIPFGYCQKLTAALQQDARYKGNALLKCVSDLAYWIEQAPRPFGTPGAGKGLEELFKAYLRCLGEVGAVFVAQTNDDESRPFFTHVGCDAAKIRFKFCPVVDVVFPRGRKLKDKECVFDRPTETWSDRETLVTYFPELKNKCSPLKPCDFDSTRRSMLFDPTAKFNPAVDFIVSVPSEDTSTKPSLLLFQLKEYRNVRENSRFTTANALEKMRKGYESFERKQLDAFKAKFNIVHVLVTVNDFLEPSVTLRPNEAVIVLSKMQASCPFLSFCSIAAENAAGIAW